MNVNTLWPVLACLAITPLATLTTGCTSRAAEYCDYVCDCNRCNAREYDECVVRYDAEEDVASAYDCDREFDDAHVCIMNNIRCNSLNIDVIVNCAGRVSDLNSCKNRRSSL